MAIDRNLLSSVYSDCGLECIPLKKISELSSNVGLGDVDFLVAEIRSLDLTLLENDAGDIGDEYWRITASTARILATLGSSVIPKLKKHRDSRHRYVEMLIEMIEGALDDPNYFS